MLCHASVAQFPTFSRFMTRCRTKDTGTRLSVQPWQGKCHAIRLRGIKGTAPPRRRPRLAQFRLRPEAPEPAEPPRLLMLQIAGYRLPRTSLSSADPELRASGTPSRSAAKRANVVRRPARGEREVRRGQAVPLHPKPLCSVFHASSGSLSGGG